MNLINYGKKTFNEVGMETFLKLHLTFSDIQVRVGKFYFFQSKNEICLMISSSLEWRVLIASFVSQMVSDSRRLSE